MCELSIIIPVYMAEKYIDSCLKNILNNDYDFFEVLLLNDESKDSSLKIIKKYEQKDKRVKAFDLSHRGVSEIRNFGLEKARGKYITFIDVDDEVSEDYIEVIRKNLGYDLIVFGFYTDFEAENYKIRSKSYNKIYDDTGKVLNDLFELNLYNFVWNKIYRKDLIGDIRFSDTYYQGEDLAFNCFYIKKCHKVKMIEDCLYFYKKRWIESMSDKFVRDYDLVLNKKIEVLNNTFNDLDHKNKYRKTLDTYLLKELEVFVINLYKDDTYTFSQRNKLIKENVFTRLDIIKGGKAIGAYTKIFKGLAITSSAFLVNITYLILYTLKNKFKTLHLYLRRLIYKNYASL